MPQNEITNNRPSNYSNWHRINLPSKYFMTDGDWFEQRYYNDELIIVAYIETIQIPYYSAPKEYPVWDSKKALIKEISKKMKIPCYIVWHTDSCSIFYINKIDSHNIIKMNENEFIQFIKGL